MQSLSPAGQNAVSDIAFRYNLSTAAVEHMLISVNNGAGSMAQFNCPELGGSGQWMRGGMIMVGDMFNQGLTSTVNNLCNELSQLLASTQVFPVLPTSGNGAQWWSAELGVPTSSGGQNNSRYAVFNDCLAVEVDGLVTIYETLDHCISGVSQQQGGNSSLLFSSQYGTVPVSSLPIRPNEHAPVNAESTSVSHGNQSCVGASSSMTESSSVVSQTHDDYSQVVVSEALSDGSTSVSLSGDQLISLIEKLAQLHGAGIMREQEFSDKKRELLARL